MRERSEKACKALNLVLLASQFGEFCSKLQPSQQISQLLPTKSINFLAILNKKNPQLPQSLKNQLNIVNPFTSPKS